MALLAPKDFSLQLHLLATFDETSPFIIENWDLAVTWLRNFDIHNTCRNA